MYGYFDELIILFLGWLPTLSPQSTEQERTIFRRLTPGENFQEDEC